MAWVKIADRSTNWNTGGSSPASYGDERLYWKIFYDNNQDNTNNRTKIKIEHYVQFGGGASGGTGSFVSGTSRAIVNSSTNLDVSYNNVAALGLEYIGSKETWVEHSNSGDGSFTFKGTGLGDLTKSTSTSTYNLPSIPRVSTITNNSSSGSRKDFGNDVSFTINRKSSSYTHTLSYTVAGIKYTIGTGITTSTDYSFPIELINNFISSATPNITVTCATMNGSTQIGTASTTVYLNVPSSYIPTCDLAIEDENLITKAWGIWVKSKSILKGIITAEGVAGSTIGSYLSIIEGQSLTTNPFTKTLSTSGDISISSSATDSRGRQASDIKNIIVLDYTVPTIVSASIKRCFEDGTLDDFGTYGKVVCNYDISSLNDNNEKYLKVKLGGIEKTFSLTDYSGTLTATSEQLFEGLEIDTTYNFIFELIDSFETIPQGIPVNPSYVLMSKRAGGKGLTLGRVASEDGLHVYMETVFHDEINIEENNEIFPMFEWEETEEEEE